MRPCRRLSTAIGTRVACVHVGRQQVRSAMCVHQTAGFISGCRQRHCSCVRSQQQSYLDAASQPPLH